MIGATKRADESGKSMDRGQRLVDDTRKLIDASHRIFERNLLAYKEAEAMFRRRRDLVAESRSKIRQQGTWRRERLRRVLISVRIDEGRLPNVLLPIVSGAGIWRRVRGVRRRHAGGADGHGPTATRSSISTPTAM